MDLILDNEDGEVLVNTKNGKKPLTDENNNIIKRYVRSFINYVSLGYDARVGYNFDPKERIQEMAINVYIFVKVSKN